MASPEIGNHHLSANYLLFMESRIPPVRELRNPDNRGRCSKIPGLVYVRPRAVEFAERNGR